MLRDHIVNMLLAARETTAGLPSTTWSPYVMYRREELFGDDAEEFRPERWETDADWKTIRPTWEYIPFNGGPRICPGQKFTLTEASYTIARLLHVFAEIESVDDTEWQKITLSLTLKDGVRCRFKE
ncbi:n-alkane-inducible cytochrome P450 [Penicillium hispanicum]|uniref:n-alkane-inducible cytochrome P450 n=1 Tax=Penicillium hispanicum TaxID=1080232 RepID=UPI0025413ADA|nr:n-alkane-inducible cytochrome P450 [Penicillium hispanicum]KAJ5595120.1 n-alkane-inducible cytochrome P450 [Penicillium hispanicum]